MKERTNWYEIVDDDGNYVVSYSFDSKNEVFEELKRLNEKERKTYHIWHIWYNKKIGPDYFDKYPYVKEDKK